MEERREGGREAGRERGREGWREERGREGGKEGKRKCVTTGMIDEQFRKKGAGLPCTCKKLDVSGFHFSSGLPCHVFKILRQTYSNNTSITSPSIRP